jgi:hypothetical protein
MNNKILDFISLVNKTFGRYPEVSGGCYKFHLILKSVFGGEGYYNSNHIVTKIDGKFYDIDGEAILKEEDRYLHFSDYGEHNIEKAFKQHL